jgi:eukaryotic-like serine/threonine-protein kinase
MGPVNASIGDTDEDWLAPGTMVGEYAVEGQLGEGGMGTVYAAVHPVIAKRAAIKVLHPALSVNREMVERFIQEARSVNQIGHANIVDIFAFGTLPDGRSYFVMERLQGESLRERMQAGEIPIRDVLAILETITIALEAAHDKGVVHRDLKPDNVFLVDFKRDRPLVKLLDFGIAKLLGDGSALTERTRTGNLLGTPGYISPEQARGHAVDHRTDIYALGAMAYELLTGELPFLADNGADMIAKHLHAPPPSARAANPRVPAALDKLIVRLLAKDPDRRPSLAETRAHLRAYGDQTVATQDPLDRRSHVATSAAAPSIAPTSSGRRRSRAWLALAAAAIVAIFGVVAVMAMRGGGTRVAAPGVEPADRGAAGPADRHPGAATRPQAVAPVDPGLAPVSALPAAPTDPTAARPAKPAAKPLPQAPGTKPTKPTRPPGRPNKPARPDDDDAPM